MKILSINPNEPEADIVAQAASAMSRGGIIVYPTDTCYGIGADAKSQQAMKQITQLKGRSSAKKYSVIARDLDHARELVVVNDEQAAILESFLPGPYTFILINADFSVAQTSTLGVRIPDYVVTHRLAASFGDAYITTSANLQGQGAIYSIEDLQQKFFDQVPSDQLPDIVLDAGPLGGSPSSTVVDLTCNPPQVIRQGGAEFEWPRR